MLQKPSEVTSAAKPSFVFAQRRDLLLRVCLTAIAFLVFCLTVRITAQTTLIPDAAWTAVVFGVVYVLAVLPFVCDGKLKLGQMTVAAVLAATLIFVRVCLLHYESNDYLAFLFNWLEQMRALSPTQAMRTPIGDYNMPYLYLLLGISRAPISDMMLIKAVSCVFDLLAAYFVMKCVGLRTSRFAVRLGAYVLTLALPTVLLNSAYWCQCDSMFASLCLGTLYFILRGKQNDGKWACILWAFTIPLLLYCIFIWQG